MLALTGIAPNRRDHSLRDALRGPAILGFCFALAAAFAATVWGGPAVQQTPSATVVASAAP